MGVGFLIGGQTGALIALVIAAGMNLFSYWNSDRMVLSMYGAQEVDARTAPDLYRLVQELAGRAGLPMPRVYIIDSPQPNAFATEQRRTRSRPRPGCSTRCRAWKSPASWRTSSRTSRTATR